MRVRVARLIDPVGVIRLVVATGSCSGRRSQPYNTAQTGCRPGEGWEVCKAACANCSNAFPRS